MLLLIPKPLLLEVLKEFGRPHGNDWFLALGTYIDKYFKENKNTLFDDMLWPGRGTSIDSLKKSLGYLSATRELSQEHATGANHYIREVLVRKYAKGLTWSQYIDTIGLTDRDLIPAVSHTLRAKSIKIDKRPENTTEPEMLTTHYDAITGYWLSRFEYVSRSRKEPILGYQIDIERLDKANRGSFSGTNLAITSPSGKRYEHEIKVQLFGDFLVGYWKNTNTKNIGAFQLFVNTNMCVMTGLHLGNANDNTIQSGVWTWIKIGDEVSDEKNQQILTAKLKEPNLLTELIEKWLMLGDSIRLEDVLV